MYTTIVKNIMTSENHFCLAASAANHQTANQVAPIV